MATSTILGSVADLVTQIGNKLSKTLDTDVLIVDNNFNIVGEINRYFVQHSEVLMESMVGQVIITQKSMVIPDKNEYEICRKCAEFKECQTSGFIGVPIFFEDRVIGAVALLFPKHRSAEILKHSEVIIPFIKHIIEDLVEKIPHRQEVIELSQVLRERDQILDTICDAVVLTDSFGIIRYVNKQFTALMDANNDCVGKRIQDMIPHEIVRDYFYTRHEFENKKVLIELENRSFHGFVSCRVVQLSTRSHGVLFVFKDIIDVMQNVRAAEKGSMVTLQWLKGWLFPNEVLDRAKALAVTDEPILIKSKNRNLNEILAKGICSFSNRNLQGMTSIKVDGIYREHLEHCIFDEFGEIQKADGGSIFIKNVEDMPLYLQKDLLHFLKYGEIRYENMKPIKSNVRFIFSTTVDLNKLVEKGLFLEELYYRISENVIEIPSINNDKIVLRNMINTCIEFYKKRYGKKDVNLSKEALDYLCNHDWHEDTTKIAVLLEQIVLRYDGMVKIGDIKALDLMQEDITETIMPINEIEKQKIKSLLEEGYKKTQISSMLGISRATLYRKIEEYGL